MKKFKIFKGDKDTITKCDRCGDSIKREENSLHILLSNGEQKDYCPKCRARVAYNL